MRGKAPTVVVEPVVQSSLDASGIVVETGQSSCRESPSATAGSTGVAFMIQSSLFDSRDVAADADQVSCIARLDVGFFCFGAASAVQSSLDARSPGPIRIVAGS